MSSAKTISCVLYSVALGMDLDKAGYSELSLIAGSMSPEPLSRNNIKEALDRLNSFWSPPEN